MRGDIEDCHRAHRKRGPGEDIDDRLAVCVFRICQATSSNIRNIGLVKNLREWSLPARAGDSSWAQSQVAKAGEFQEEADEPRGVVYLERTETTGGLMDGELAICAHSRLSTWRGLGGSRFELCSLNTVDS